VLAATYPDLFSAAVAYSGVPAGCFRDRNNGVATWNSECAEGKVVKSGEEWLEEVEGMNFDYEGSWPKMQIYHGGRDNVLNATNYVETIKQWTAVSGYNASIPTSSRMNDPIEGYNTIEYGERVVGTYAPNTGHDIRIFPERDVQWFGFK
jgi:acetylxylan esterase